MSTLPRPLARDAALLVLALLASCAAPNQPREQASPRAPYSSLCEVYGFKPGTSAFEQCAREVDKAMWRQARSRSRLNCTPMGDRMVCQ